MSFAFEIRDGGCLSHKQLMASFGFKSDRACKNWIDDHDIPYTPINGAWWMQTEDIRAAIANAAKTHTERQADKANA